MPLLGHSPNKMADYGHNGYHILMYDETTPDYGSGAIATTELGIGYLVNHATDSVTIIDGGVYTSNDAPTVTVSDPNGFADGCTATATIAQIGSTGEYRVTAVEITNANETGYFAPELHFSGTNTKHPAKAYINSSGLPNPLCFYHTIYVANGTAWIGDLKMVNKAGDVISTLVETSASDTGKLGFKGQASGVDVVGVPLELESGNSISGLFRGDQITLADPCTAIGDWDAVGTSSNGDFDYQVILYIAKRGKNGGRWRKHEKPAYW